MPRVGLTRQRLTEEAGRLADEIGYDNVTLAALARRFGVAGPSVFKHVTGQDDLRQAIAVAALDDYRTDLERAVMGRSTGAAVRALLTTSRTWARDHPGRYAALSRVPTRGSAEHVAAANRVLAVLEAVVEGYGITGDDAIDAIRFVRSALHGFSSLECAGAFELDRDLTRSFDRLTDVCDAVLASWNRARVR
ncbi:TetR/AcrR family transcriptional regulator [Pseudonocardia sp. CA-107938]|uniref:TetR/AcrR family transcriptional regulator n=1 Tax=Pseudonocardia sp. CA-107938 TaxID=3240021 RepID=UPI003D8FD181